MRGDEREKDLREYGVPEAQIRAQLAVATTDDAPIEIWRESLPVWRAFERSTRCWRVGPMGQLLGLDYVQLNVVLRAMKMRNLDETLQDLDVMADAVIDVYGAKD